MVVGQRRAREIENVKRAILDAARELFATQDYQAVSLRKIAEKIEYSPAAIYRYFSDKEEILFQLIEEGFEILSGRLHAVENADPIVRLREGGRIYVDFAFTQPHYYRLMFQLDKTEMAEKYMPTCTASHSAFGFIHTAVSEAVTSGQFDSSVEAIVASCGIWATMHGAVSLALSSHLHIMMPEAFDSTFFNHMIESVIKANLP